MGRAADDGQPGPVAQQLVQRSVGAVPCDVQRHYLSGVVMQEGDWLVAFRAFHDPSRSSP